VSEFEPREDCKNLNGTTKFSYDTAAKARKAARRTRRNNGANHGERVVRAYRCPNCGWYHVGHTYPGRPKRDDGLSDIP